MASGVITEQGDLGLGFEPITEAEERAFNESKESDDSEIERG